MGHDIQVTVRVAWCGPGMPSVGAVARALGVPRPQLAAGHGGPRRSRAGPVAGKAPSRSELGGWSGRSGRVLHDEDFEMLPCPL